MATFTWEGTNAAGKKVKGKIEAANIQGVYNSLRTQKIVPDAKKIKEKGTGLDREIKIPGFQPKVKTKDLVVFTRQFATMIDAGLPIVQGIDVLGTNHHSPALKKVLLDIRDFVQNGGTLAEALARHPRAFDPLFVNMIAAGEAGGILDIILDRLANYMEKMDKLKRQVKTAMIYPAVVVGAALIVTSILLIFVIPTFAELFASFGSALPAPTQFVINLSDFLVNYGYIVFATLFGTSFIMKRFARTDRGKDILHPLFLKSPVFGDLIRKVSVARFCRTMGTMLSSGVPILDALVICAKTSGNRIVEREITKVRSSIMEGKNMSEPLLNSVIFPPMVTQMISVGESTGALDAMLAKVADFYDDEVENAVTGLKQLIEPIMILVLGVLVGGLVVAMYLPIFKLGSVM